MYIKVLKSKIHRARVTDVDINYEGSVTISEDLLWEANIKEYEAIDVYNVTNGNRFSTYAIACKPDKDYNKICVNGAAAHLVKPNDIIIIAAYGFIRENEYVDQYGREVKDRVDKVFVDDNNISLKPLLVIGEN